MSGNQQGPSFRRGNDGPLGRFWGSLLIRGPHRKIPLEKPRPENPSENKREKTTQAPPAGGGQGSSAVSPRGGLTISLDCLVRRVYQPGPWRFFAPNQSPPLAEAGVRPFDPPQKPRRLLPSPFALRPQYGGRSHCLTGALRAHQHHGAELTRPSSWPMGKKGGRRHRPFASNQGKTAQPDHGRNWWSDREKRTTRSLVRIGVVL